MIRRCSPAKASFSSSASLSEEECLPGIEEDEEYIFVEEDEERVEPQSACTERKKMTVFLIHSDYSLR